MDMLPPTRDALQQTFSPSWIPRKTDLGTMFETNATNTQPGRMGMEEGGFQEYYVLGAHLDDDSNGPRFLTPFGQVWL